MRITTIGTSDMSLALARLWEQAGHTVTSLGLDDGDATDAEVIVVAMPSDAITASLGKVVGLEGKVTIDTTNPFAGRNDEYQSLAHEVRATIRGPTAKAFNLQCPRLDETIWDLSARPTSLHAADEGAREVVELLSRDAGFEPVGVGGLENARVLEDASALFEAIGRNGGSLYLHRTLSAEDPSDAHYEDRTTGAYWVNTFRAVNDPERLAEYIHLAGPVMRESGGHFLARGQPARVYESGVMERTVVIEFPNVEQAIAAYESQDYQRALRALGDGAERDIRIIEKAPSVSSPRR